MNHLICAKNGIRPEVKLWPKQVVIKNTIKKRVHLLSLIARDL